MKKKFNLFFAVVLAMTMLFGSTLCFAAEGDNVISNVNETRDARAYTGSTNCEYKAQAFSGVVINGIRQHVTAKVNVGMRFTWNEGRDSKFTSGWVNSTTCSSVAGGNYEVHNSGMSISSNIIVFNFDVYRDNTKVDSFNVRYIVDEYGQIEEY